MTAPTLEATLSASELDQLRDHLATVEAWPAGSHVWGHYAEATEAGTTICRTENVSACVPWVRDLVDGRLAGIAAAALGEPVAAFKDKVNYKQPGGAGFRPHQDLPAYPGIDRVVSVLLAVDPCDEVAGCLWMAPPAAGVLPTDDRGVITAIVTDGLAWSACPLRAGDALVIDGLAPHYSDSNRSRHPRRVLVASYAPQAAGYGRAAYYAERAAAMAEASRRDGRSRISTLADFDGIQVAPSAVATDTCTHD